MCAFLSFLYCSRYSIFVAYIRYIWNPIRGNKFQLLLCKDNEFHKFHEFILEANSQSVKLRTKRNFHSLHAIMVLHLPSSIIIAHTLRERESKLQIEQFTLQHILNRFVTFIHFLWVYCTEKNIFG